MRIGRSFLAFLFCVFLILFSKVALPLPEGGQVRSGAVEIEHVDSLNMEVHQGTDRAVIDWRSFDVGIEESVHFRQPDASSALLNRIYDTKASEIYGSVTANGRLFLVNQHGIYFSRNASLKASSLVASSLDLTIEDFNAGLYRFSGEGGLVLNHGLLEASLGGSVSLLGGQVENGLGGRIIAERGEVNLLSGKVITMDFSGDGLLRFVVEEGLAGALVLNSGEIDAEGGSVLLSGIESRSVFSNVVNNAGVISAGGIDVSGGQIRLVSNSGVVNTGRLDASGRIGGEVEMIGSLVEHTGEAVSEGRVAGGRVLLEGEDEVVLRGGFVSSASSDGVGGLVHVLGNHVMLLEESTLSASGASGGGELLIGGDYLGGNSLVRNSQLTYVSRGTQLEASANVFGEGGRVIVWSDNRTYFYGSLNVSGVSRGGFAEISGKVWLDFRPDIIDLSAIEPGQLLLDPATIEVVESAPDINGDGTVGDDIVGLSDLEDDQSFSGVASIITSGALEGLLQQAHVRLAATDSITFNAELSSSNGNHLFLTAPIVTINQSITLGGEIRLSGDTVININAPVTGSPRAFRGGTGVDTFNINADIIGNLSGGAGNDIFNIDAPVDGTIFGGTGDDIFNINADVIGNLSGAAGNDTFNYISGVINLVDGVGDMDTLVGANAAATWTFIASNNSTYDLGGDGVIEFRFVNLETYIGGTLSDTFNIDVSFTGSLSGNEGNNIFNINADVTGSLFGGAGNDTFNINTSFTGSLSGNEGDDTFNINAFVTGSLFGGSEADIFNINADVTGSLFGDAGDDTFNYISGVVSNVDGGTGMDSLVGANAAATWTFEANDQNTYDVGGDGVIELQFSNLETYTGGTLSDTFNINADVTGSLSGGAGNDTFNINTSFTGSLSGNEGDDIFNINADVTGSLFGDAGDDTFNYISGVVSNGVDGGTGIDSLVGANAAATWTFEANDQNTYNVGGDGVIELQFSNLETYTSGSGADTFNINADVTGSLSGNEGNDIFNINASVTGSLFGDAGDDVFNYISGVVSNVDGGEGIDSLVGANAAATWTFAANDQNTYNVEGDGVIELQFSNLETYTSGSGADTFNINTSFTGSLSGNEGNDIFNINADVTGSLFGDAGDDTFNYISGVVSNGVDGGEGMDSLVGANAAATWTFEANDQNTYDVGGDGVIELQFSNLETYTGGTLSDTFNINTSFTGSLSGNDGDDTFNINADVTGSLFGDAGDDTFNINTSFTGSLSGNEGNDIFNINADVTGSLFGDAGDDTFNYISGVVSNVDGGEGIDSLVGANAAATWTFGANDQNTYDVGGDGVIELQFSNLETYTSGSGADTFNINADVTGSLSGNDGDDIFNINADVTGSLFGDAGDDTFNYISGVVSNGVDGGEGMDSLVGANAAATWTFEANDQNTYDVGGDGVIELQFSNLETYTGGTLSDTFNINASFTGSLSGNEGDDTFNINADVTGSLSGNEGNDIFNINASVTGSLSGGGGMDTLNHGLTDLLFRLKSSSGNGFGGEVTKGSTKLLDFSGIDIINAKESRLRGYNIAATWDWNLGGSTYTAEGHTLGFSGMERYIGGERNDVFNINVPVTGYIFSLGGIDTFNINDTLTIRANGALGSIDSGIANDIFNINALVIGNIRGGNGNDTFNINADVTGSLFGDAGNDTFNYISGIVSNGVDGGTGIDSLVGANAAVTWTFEANDQNTYDVGGDGVIELQFSNFETYTSGSGADTFNINADVTGSLSGGAGNDTFNINASVTGSLFGDAGDDTFNYISGVVSNGVDGGEGMDSLVGANAAATWTFEANDQNTYDVGGDGVIELQFSNFETYTSGSGADTFNIDAPVTGSLSGNEGNDIFNINADVTGSLFGDAGDDVFNYVSGVVSNGVDGGEGMDSLSYVSAIAVTLTGSSNNGFSGNTVLTNGSSLGNFSGIDVINAHTGTGDSLTGYATTATWDLGSSSSYMAEGHTLGFSGFEDYTGGTLSDTFNINADVTGSLSGGAGDDTFNYISGVVSNVDGGEGIDSLVGANAAATWTFAANDQNTYNVGGDGVIELQFSNFETYTSGSGADTFNINADVTGSLSGNEGDDIFNINADVTGSLFGDAGDDTFNYISGVVSNGVDGGEGIDSLVGANAAATWTFEANDQNTYDVGGDGVIELQFSNFETYTSGSEADTFNINASFTGSLSGGAGNDIFNINADVTGALFGDGGNDVFNIDTLVEGELSGGLGADTFYINALVEGGLYGNFGADTFNIDASVTGSLSGGTGDDTFNYISGVVSNGVDGGEGMDSLVGANAAATWTFEANDQNTYNVGGDGVIELQFSNLETYTSGSGADTFNINADVTGSLSGNEGNDIFNINADVTGSLFGDAGDDTFNYISGVVSNGVDGGEGMDSLVGANAAATWTFGANDQNTYDVGGDGVIELQFSNLETYTSGSGADTFNINADVTGSLSGNDGDDIFNINADVTGSLFGDAGDDTFNYISGVVSNGVDGGEGIDSLVGANAAATWTFEANDQNTYDVGGDGVIELQFSNFETYTSGSEADTFNINASFTGSLSGGAGNDIFNINADVTGALFGDGGNDVFNIDTLVEGELSGGLGADTFYINALVEGGLYGNFGADTFNIDASVTGSLFGDAGDDVFNYISGVVSNGVDGGEGMDSLVGANAAATWTFEANDQNTYNVGGDGVIELQFSNFETYTSGSGADTFNINADVTGSLSGNEGNDIFNINADVTGSLSGGAGDDTFNYISGVVSNGVDGGEGMDSLVGANAAATWTFEANDQNTYNVGGDGVIELQFSNLETYTSGSGADTFNINADVTGSLSGNDGDDIFNINADVTGSLFGDAGDDTFNYISGVVSNVDGGEGIDSLVGANAAATWTFGANDQNTYNVGGDGVIELQFSNFETYTSGSGADTFNINASFTGSLSGNEGDDTFNINADVTGFLFGDAGDDTFNYMSGVVSNGVDGGEGMDSLVGANAAATWTFGANDQNTYNVGGDGVIELQFSNFETYTGGTLSDTFNYLIAVAVTLTGSSDNGFSGNTVLANALISGSSLGNFSGIDVINAHTGTGDSLTGYATAATWDWDLGGSTYRAENRPLVFSNFETYTGGILSDTFNINTSFTGSLSGGAGNDIFNINADVTGALFGDGGNDVFNIDTLVEGELSGGLGADTFYINALVEGGLYGNFGADTFNIDASVTGSLSGGTGDDTFNYISGVVSNGVDGGEGIDSLVGANAAATWTFEANDQNTYDVGGDGVIELQFSNFETYTSGSEADTFNINADVTGSLSGNEGDDTFNINADVTGSLFGDAGDDIFNINADVTGSLFGDAGDDTFNYISGVVSNVDGGEGIDSLVGANAAATWTFAANDQNTYNVGGDGVIELQFSNFETYTGGTLSDTFNYLIAIAVTLTGSSDNGFSGNTVLANGSSLGNFSGIDVINAHTGTGDSLTGYATTATWDLGSSSSYMAEGHTLGFSGFEDYTGGTLSDTFNINVLVEGELSGGAGNDTFNINADVTGSLSGDAGDDTFNYISGVVSNGVDGGTGIDSLVGANAAATWTFEANDQNTYNVGGDGVIELQFSNFETYTSGSGADTFNINADVTGSLSGNDGDDIFNINADVTGSLFGDAGDDTFNYISGVVSNGVDGGEGMDSLVGANAAATWTFEANDQNTYNVGGDGVIELQFSNFETYTGGTLSDTFNIDASVTGSLSGGTGDDTFNYISGVVSNGVDGGEGMDSLVGANAAATWTFEANDQNTYDVGGDGVIELQFSNLETYTSGSGADTFNINADVTGSLSGNDGDDIFNINADVTGSLFGDAGDDTFNYISGVVSNVDGGEGMDSLVGANAAATWTFEANDQNTYDVGGDGVIELQFSNFETYTSGSEADTFNINTSFTGSLSGNEGDDTFNINADVTGSLSGNEGHDTFNINASVTGSLFGDAGNDVFNINGQVTGDISGGEDLDNLSYVSAVAVTLTGSSDNGFSGNTVLANGSSLGNFSGIGIINAHTGAGDSLTGYATTATWDWDLRGSTYTAENRPLVFSNFETYTGGTLSDTFNINTSFTGSLSGNDGDDTFNINADVTGSLFGDAGDDTFNYISGVVSNVDGGTGMDSLVGANAAATWTFEANDQNTYDVGGDGVIELQFSNFETYTSGSEADTFNINASFTGSLSGNEGNDIFNINADVTGSLFGDAGDDTFNYISGVVSNGVDGGEGMDSLVGANAAATWTFAANDQNTYNVGGDGVIELQFSNLETYTSGSGADTFNINASFTGSLSGNDGDDIFNINADVTGSLFGDAGDDTFNYISGVVSNVDGGTGMDSLVGANAAATWTFEANDQNTYDVGGDGVIELQFSNLETYTGGTLSDTFNINASVTGSLFGDAGDDTFNYISGVVSNGVDGGEGMDSLVGANAAATWTFEANDQNTYDVGGDGVIELQFSNFETYTSGSGADTFNINADVTGSLSGNEGDDIFNINADVTGSLFGDAGDDTFNYISGVVSNGVDGGEGIDSLVGANAAVTWTFEANDQNTYNVGGDGITELQFSNLETYTGGTLSDTFNINADVTGSLSGGAGNDTFNINTSFTGSLSGNEGDDIFNINADVTGSLFGDAGDDTFNYISGVVSNGVDGGTGIDSLVGANAAATWTFEANDQNTYNVGGDGVIELQFSNLETYTSGSEADTFNINADVTGSLSGNEGNDIFNINADVTGSLFGDAGDDTFNYISGVVSNGVDGGEGMDSLVGANAAATWTFGANDQNTYNVGGDGVIELQFSNLETYTSGSGADTFNINADVTGSLSGNEGNDIFNINADVTGSLFGDAGDDTFNYISGVVSNGVDGGEGIDSLVGANAAATWTFGANDQNTYNVGGDGVIELQFSNFETYTSGSGADTFNYLIAIRVTLTGSSDNGFSGNTVLANGSSLGNFSGIDVINAHTGTGDSLTGYATAATWDLGSSSSYMAEGHTLGFSGFEDYTGGALSDTFNINADVTGSLSGDAGDDTFNYISGVVSNGVDGGEGMDSLVGANAAATWTFGANDQNTYDVGGDGVIELQFSNFETYTSGSEADTFNINASFTGSLSGNEGNDIFNINADVTGSLSGNEGDDTFNINADVTGSLSGNEGNDTFNINADVTGSLFGDAGDDTFNYISGVVSNVDGGTGMDSLVGANATATWTFEANDQNTYDVGGDGIIELQFSNFETYTGGTLSDTFNYLIAITVTLTDSSDNGFSGNTVLANALISGSSLGNFSGIDVINAHTGTGDSLTGYATAATWDWDLRGSTYTAENRPLVFSNFETYTGGTLSDTFNINTSFTGSLSGGTGMDSLSYVSAVAVTLTGSSNNGFSGNTVLTNGSSLGNFSGIDVINAHTGTGDSLTGYATAATWDLSSSSYMVEGHTLGFSGFEDYTGGTLSDTFNINTSFTGSLSGNDGDDIFNINADVTGSLFGDAGDDVFNYMSGVVSNGVDGGEGMDSLSYVSAVAVTLTGSSDNGFSGNTVLANDSSLGNFSGIDVINAHTGTGDSLTGYATAATWDWNLIGFTYTAEGHTLGFSGFEDYTGGTLSDTFNINVLVEGELSGGAGNDTFNINADVTGSLSGDAGDDVFHINTSVTGSLSGGTGNDTFNINADVTGSFSGDAGDDTFNYISGVVSNGVDGGEGMDSLSYVSAVAVTLTGSSNNGFSGNTVLANGSSLGNFSGIDVINVDIFPRDSLTGYATTATWDLGSSSSYTAEGHTLGFSGFEDYTGGTLSDTFNINADVTGSLSGDAGNDTFNYISGIVSNVDGGTGIDSLVGANAAATWTFEANDQNTYNVGGDGVIELQFSNFETYTGGTLSDTFNINADVTGSLSGNEGNDIFNINADVTGSLFGDAGDDTFNYISGVVSNGVDGGEGMDSLVGANAAATWTFGANDQNTYDVGGDGVIELQFSNLETYTSGSGADTFNINASFTGSLSGGAGDDIFNINASVTGSLSGGEGMDSLSYIDSVAVTLTGSSDNGFSGNTVLTNGSSLGNFSGIDVINAHAEPGDSLTGYATAATWDLGSSSSYMAEGHTLGFSGFEDYTGGTLSDTFNINADVTGSLSGDAGDDTFNYISGAVSNGVDGGEGMDSLSYVSAVAVTLTGSSDNGFSGNTVLTNGSSLGNFSGIDVINAHTEAGDSLTGYATTATWDLGNSSSYMAEGHTLGFSGFEDYTGGTLSDTFNINAPVTGSLSGGEGMDSLSYVSAVAVTLTGSSDNGFSGNTVLANGSSLGNFSGIDVINAHTGTGDSLTGYATTATWDWDLGGSTYRAENRPLVFSNFETYTGGTLSDTFNINADVTGSLSGNEGHDTFNINASVTGSLFGDAGNDVFNINGQVTGDISGGEDLDNLSYVSAVAVTLTGSSDNGFSGNTVLANGSSLGNFSGIGIINAHTEPGDSLTGYATAATWDWDLRGSTYTAENRPLVFSNFETYTGGTLSDTFNINTSFTGSLSGGAGDDIFNINADVTGSLSGGEGMDSLSYVSAVAVTLTGSSDNGFSGNTVLANGSSLGNFSGIDVINAHTGTGDSLTGYATAATWDLGNSSSYTAEGHTLGFSGFEDYTGGTLSDTFNINALVEGELSGGTGNDTFNINADVTGSLFGDAGDDTFNYISGVVSNGVDGGEGIDSLVGANAAATWTFEANDQNTYDVGGDGVIELQFSNFETYTGGTLSDTFNYLIAIAVTLTGSSDNGFSGNTVLANGSSLGNFSGIDVINAHAEPGDSLTGYATTATWDLGSSSSYMAEGHTLGFSGFEDYTGGTLSDTFNINADVTGSLFGDAGDDTFNYISGVVSNGVDGGEGMDSLSYVSAVAVTLTSSSDNGFSGNTVLANGSSLGNFSGIDVINAHTGTGDSLTGYATTATWDLSSNSYTAEGHTLGFSGFEDYTGGTLSDTFNINALVEGELSGGAGNDTFNINADVTGALFGDAGDDVFHINTSVTGSLSGGAGNDTFNINADVTGALFGDAGDDVFHINTSVTGSLSGGTGNDTFNINADVTGSFSGGAGDDTFNYISGVVSNGVDGGEGEDTLISSSNLYVSDSNAISTDYNGSSTAVFNEIDTVVSINGSDASPVMLSAGTIFNGVIRIEGVAEWSYDNGVQLANTVLGDGKLQIPSAPLGSNTITVDSNFLKLPDVLNFEGTLVIGGRVYFADGRIGGSFDNGVLERIETITDFLVVEKAIETNGYLYLLSKSQTTVAENITAKEISLNVFLEGGVVVGGRGVQLTSIGAINFFALSGLESSNQLILTGLGARFHQSPNIPEPEIHPDSLLRMPLEPLDLTAFEGINSNLVPVSFTIATSRGFFTELDYNSDIDSSLFEEELNLLDIVGKGLALSLSQCEEQEGCSPSVTEEEIQVIIAELEQRIADLELLLLEMETDDVACIAAADTSGCLDLDIKVLITKIGEYNKRLSRFRQYMEDLMALRAAEEGFEGAEELVDVLPDANDQQIDKSIEDRISRLNTIISTMEARINWLKSLLKQPERLSKIAERSGINVDLEELETIILATEIMLRNQKEKLEDAQSSYL